MSPTCQRHVGTTVKCRHFGPTRPCRADTKLIRTQHFRVGDGRQLPLSSLSTRGRYNTCTTCQKSQHTTTNMSHAPRRPTLHRLETSPSMGRPAAPPNHGAAASYRLAQGERSQVMQSRCWFPCLGHQRKPYQ